MNFIQDIDNMEELQGFLKTISEWSGSTANRYPMPVGILTTADHKYKPDLSVISEIVINEASQQDINIIIRQNKVSKIGDRITIDGISEIDCILLIICSNTEEEIYMDMINIICDRNGMETSIKTTILTNLNRHWKKNNIITVLGLSTIYKNQLYRYIEISKAHINELSELYNWNNIDTISDIDWNDIDIMPDTKILSSAPIKYKEEPDDDDNVCDNSLNADNMKTDLTVSDEINYELNMRCDHLEQKERDIISREVLINNKLKKIEEKEKKLQMEEKCIKKSMEDLARVSNNVDISSDRRIRLNIAGKIFEIYQNTLINHGGSYWRTILANTEISSDKNSTSTLQEKNEIFLDHDPKSFKMYLRCVRTNGVAFECYSSAEQKCIEYEAKCFKCSWLVRRSKPSRAREA